LPTFKVDSCPFVPLILSYAFQLSGSSAVIGLCKMSSSNGFEDGDSSFRDLPSSPSPLSSLFSAAFGTHPTGIQTGARDVPPDLGCYVDGNPCTGLSTPRPPTDLVPVYHKA
jgi:hypothetical protein